MDAQSLLLGNSGYKAMPDRLNLVFEMVKEGCLVFWFTLDGERVRFPVYRGKGSLNVLVCKAEKESLCQRIETFLVRNKGVCDVEMVVQRKEDVKVTIV